MDNKNEQQNIIEKFKEIVENIEYYTRRRKEITKNHFEELLETVESQVKTNEAQIAEIVGKHAPYPLVFLASSLGFTKSNWNKTAEKICLDLNLPTRLRYGSFDNMKRYEILKLLILKYIDKKYRNK